MSDSGLSKPQQRLDVPPKDPSPSTPGVPPGWYYDSGAGKQRWWDGVRWTNLPPGPPPSHRSKVLGAISAFFGVFALFGGIFGGSSPFWSLITFIVNCVILTAVITSIVAISTNRGRAGGITGLCLGVIGFIISVLFV